MDTSLASDSYEKRATPAAHHVLHTLNEFWKVGWTAKTSYQIEITIMFWVIKTAVVTNAGLGT